MHRLVLVTLTLTLGLRAGTPLADEPVTLTPWIVEEPAFRPNLDAPRASAVLERDAWSGRAVGTLADAIARVPGVIMLESHGGFEPPRLSLRGSGLQSAPVSRGVTLLLDGLPLGLADGSFNIALFDPQLGATIAVQRGLDAWRASPAALGGAFDLQSARTADTTVRAEAGSFGVWRGRVSSSFVPAAGWFAGTALSYSRQTGHRPLSSQERTALHASLRRTIAGGEAAFTLYHARPKYEVPGPLTYAVATTAPRTNNSDVLRDRPSRESEFWRAAATYTARTTEREFDAGASLARTDDRFQQLQANGYSLSRSDDAAARLSFAQRFTAGGLRQQARLTVYATRGWRDLRRFRNDSAAIGPLFGRDGLYATTVALALEDSIALTRTLSATLAVARVGARRDIVDRLTAPRTTQDLGYGNTTPQIAVRWTPATDLALFAGVSRGVEQPTFDDLLIIAGAYPNLARRSQALRAQRATTWEAGARGQRAALGWDVTLYRADWTDEILRLADARGAALGAVNANPTRHEGLEASARWRLLDGPDRLTFNTTAVWSHFHFTGDPVYGRNRLAGVPPFVGSAELLYENRRGCFAALGADRTAGRLAVDHGGRMTYTGRTLAHARLGWRQGHAWTVFLDVRNLLDRDYIASTAGVLDLVRNPAATSIFIPGPRRNLTLGLEWKR
ncbi:MAG: TonB-dependent receptor [Verrucomicrobia bacterium]|nr:TonB-dependent receptor [Verrucomicrobiota bacterium]